MDVKEEDSSKESRDNHITYYITLTKIISEIQEEKVNETALIEKFLFVKEEQI